MDLNTLRKDTSIKGDADILGGGGALDSDVYTATIKMAYYDKAKSGAVSVNFEFEMDNGRTFKSTEWVTSGTAKGGLPYYTDAKQNKRYLPGYITTTAIAEMATGKELADLEPETKTIKIYDFNEKKEVPAERPVIMELLGKVVKLAVIKQEVTVNEKVGDEYVPTDKTRTQNEIKKVFHGETGKTATELSANAEASFVNQWKEKYAGTVEDKTTKAEKTATAGAPTGTSKPASKSLFD